MSELDKAYTFHHLQIRLIEILEEENEDLKNHSTSQIQKNLEEKTKLCHLYERQTKIIKMKPDILKSMDKEELDEMRKLSKQLEELIEDNAKRLSTAIDTTRRIFSYVSSAAVDMSKSQNMYSKSGTMGSSSSEPIKPFAMNNTI